MDLVLNHLYLGHGQHKELLLLNFAFLCIELEIDFLLLLTLVSVLHLVLHHLYPILGGRQQSLLRLPYLRTALTCDSETHQGLILFQKVTL